MDCPPNMMALITSGLWLIRNEIASLSIIVDNPEASRGLQLQPPMEYPYCSCRLTAAVSSHVFGRAR